MNLIEAFCRQVKERPDALAMVETRRGKSRSISFAELDAASQRVAAMLHASGLRPGDGVLLLQPMSIDLYVALIAIFRLGLVATIFDPSAGRGHIERCCAIYPPAAFIGSMKAHVLRLFSASIRRIPRKYVIGGMLPGAISWRKADTYMTHAAVHPCEADTPALLTFTSGSTGLPKAAMRTHGFLLAQHRVLAGSLELQPGEVDLTTLPIFALANLASGVTSIIPDADMRVPGRVDPAPILSQITAWQPTRTGASPAFLDRLVGESLQRKEPIPHLRKIYTGGAPVFPSFLRKLRQAAPSATILPVYGSTEAEPIAHLAMDEISDEDFEAMAQGKGLLAGRPVPDIHVRIIQHQWGQPIGPCTAEGFAAVCLPAGKPGEIVVSGAHVLPGYWQGQGDAETKFQVEGAPWHRTGDAGYLDSCGRLWLLGRCAALTELDTAANPYLQWILTGRHTTALPYALRPEHFEAIRANLDRLEWQCRPLEDFLDAVGEDAIDRYNLSDIFEYMSLENYHRLLERLVRAGRPGGRLVYWNMLTPRKRPESMVAVLATLDDVAEQLFRCDKAFFYSAVVVEEMR